MSTFTTPHSPMRFRLACALLAAAAFACGKGGPRGWPQTSLGEIDHGPGWINPSLTLDPQGRPVVGYTNAPLTFAANQAWVKRWNGSAWEALGGQLNTSGTEAGSPQLAIDSGDVVAVWAEAPPSSSLQETIRAARWTGSSWTPIGAQVTPAGTYGNGLRFAAGAQGPIVTYTQWATSASGTVTRWDGVSWRTYPPTPSMGATYLDLALQADGSPLISWAVQTTSPQYTVKTLRWDVPSLAWIQFPANTYNSTVNTSIALDASGGIFLASGPPPAASSDPGLPVLRAGGTSWDGVGAPQGGAGSFAHFVHTTGPLALINLEPRGYTVSQYLGGTQWEAIAELPNASPGGHPCGLTATDTTVFAACPVWGLDVDANGHQVSHLLAMDFRKP